MTLLEAQTLTLRVLKQVMKEKLDRHNVQLAQVTLPISIPNYLALKMEKDFEIFDEVKLKEIIDAM